MTIALRLDAYDLPYSLCYFEYPEIKNIGEDPKRAGIVHRLDQPVSGVMVVARTQDFYSYVKAQFRDRKVRKKYLALVLGEVKEDSGEISFPIARSCSKKTRRVARPMGQAGDEALTQFRVVKRYHHYTLLEIIILTGRTHQIRVHMKAVGHPIVGDRKYQGKIKEKDPLNRVFLHASELGFVDLRGNEQKYQSPLPKDLKDYLKTLKEIVAKSVFRDSP